MAIIEIQKGRWFVIVLEKKVYRFYILHNWGFNVEIFSYRESTLEFVERVGISSLVDMIVCGDDQVVVVQCSTP